MTGSDGSSRELIVHEADGYEGEIRELPLGVIYSVSEAVVPGYECSISQADAQHFNVTNTLRTTEVSVRKVWDDDGATERRPVSVAVTLRGSDGTARQATLSNANGWVHTWTGLPEVDENGSGVVYTVEEEAVEDYDSRVTGTVDSGFTITNTLQTGYGKALKEASEEGWL